MARGNFRDLVQRLVKSAIEIVGDLNESVVYEHVTATDYDTTSGLPIKTSTIYGTVDAPLYGLVSKFGSTEIDNKVIVATDAKLTVAYLDLPIEPQTQDELTLMGKTWNPVRVISAPGSPLWVIHIRAI